MHMLRLLVVLLAGASGAARAPSYNLTVAVRLAEASYCTSNNTFILPSSLAAHATVVAVHEARGARVVVGVYDDGEGDAYVFASFRGTENYENWADNLKVVREHPYRDDYENAGVEIGFVKWYDGLLKGLTRGLDAARALRFPNAAAAPLFVTGHSAGGAVATLMAFDVLRGGVFEGLRLEGTITFGSPRVGNAAFAAAFGEIANGEQVEHWRVTHRRDVIPHMPETRLGFLHVSNELWQPTDDAENIVACDDGDGAEDPRCSNSCAPLHCTSKADHLTYLGVPLGIAGCA